MASTTRSLTSFKALSFDVYATLIDWETGIITALTPLTDRLPSSHPSKNNRRALLQLYTRLEGELEHKYPDLQYNKLLGEVYAGIAEELGLTSAIENHDLAQEKEVFGQAVGTWPAFPDTVAALQVLGRHYKLIILSNVDAANISRTIAGPLQNTPFAAVYTAQQIGSYKPDLRNFEFLIEHAGTELGVAKEEILHTAQALWHDHVPAKKIGLKSCWIERGGDDPDGAVIGGRIEDLEGQVELECRFKTLGDMAEAVEKAFQSEHSG